MKLWTEKFRADFFIFYDTGAFFILQKILMSMSSNGISFRTAHCDVFRVIASEKFKQSCYLFEYFCFLSNGKRTRGKFMLARCTFW